MLTSSHAIVVVNNTQKHNRMNNNFCGNHLRFSVQIQRKKSKKISKTRNISPQVRKVMRTMKGKKGKKGKKNKGKGSPERTATKKFVPLQKKNEALLSPNQTTTPSTD